MSGEAFPPELSARLVSWTKRYPYPVMGLLEALREVQEAYRCVPEWADAPLAELFKVSPRRVRELATFYPYFTARPTGRYRFQVCRNLSCSLGGCARALEGLKSRLGVGAGETTPDGLFSYEETECLGACDQAPAFTVNDELQGPAVPENLELAIEEARRGRVRRPELPLAWEGGALLTRHFADPGLRALSGYKRLGGYAAWEKAKGLAPGEIIAEVQASNLRGLGGAGFPVGLKWATVPPKKERQQEHYLVANADESEPGCFKDRALMERNPHALIEGMLIAGRAIEADVSFIFIRGEYARQYRVLEAALDEARAAGLLETEILLMRGANAYISGCDTALLETMEGKKAWPRQPPPFPTVWGLMGKPTVVNNVETLMMVPAVFASGAKAFAGLGVPKSGGTAVYSVSGHVARPGVYEFPMGAPFKDILAAAGGVRGGKALKAVIPGGTSTPALTAEEALGARMDFDSLRGLGSFLGAGGVVVLDESADMVRALYVIERFLRHESCGQCTPCREGSGWIARILARILEGNGRPDDVENLLRIGDNVTGKVICALGDTVGMVARAMLSKFRPDFESCLKAPAGAAPASAKAAAAAAEASAS